MRAKDYFNISNKEACPIITHSSVCHESWQIGLNEKSYLSYMISEKCLALFTKKH